MGLRNLLYASAFSFLTILGCGKKESPTQPAVNHPPVIERIVFDPTVPLTEERVRLECIANDPDNDPLYYDWRSDGGYFDEVDKKQVTWNSPKEIGTYHITVKIDDRREIGTASRTSSLVVISRFDTLKVIEDAFTDRRNHNMSHNSVFLMIFNAADDTWFSEPHIRFDLSTLKRGVRSAKLRLTCYDSVRRLTCDFHRIKGQWNETTLTYNNRPIYDLTPFLRFTIPSTGEGDFIYVENMRDILEFWRNNPLENYGFLMRPIDTTGVPDNFYSKEGAERYRNYDAALTLIMEYE